MKENKQKGAGSVLAELQEQYRLLQQEYEYERDFYREQTERAGIGKRIQQGVCWYPVTVEREYYNSLNQLVVEVGREHSEDADHHFEHGRPVCFFRPGTDGKLHHLNFSSVISYVQDDKMVVVLPDSAALSELKKGMGLGVQLYFDDTSYKVMFSAITGVMNAKEGRLAVLREVLLGNSEPGQREIYPSRFPWLNGSQDEAVNKVLRARDVAVVHGPPGTGKTTTLVEAVYETLHRENQVLVCAQSNTAVDWIAEKLSDRGVNVLRIGNPTRVNDKMLAFTYERRFESHPFYPELWNLRKTVREIYAQLRKEHAGGKETLRNRLSKMRGRITELEMQIEEQLFGEARVIACTLIGTANKILVNRRFSTLFIDEAAQALEAACWTGIAKADRVILAGDHCQLPPTIKCFEAARKGLDRTLLQKVVNRKPGAVSLLKMQYRMHRDIMQFSSDWFYQGQLEASPDVGTRSILEYDTPVEWYDTAACDLQEGTVSEVFGRINKPEAELLIARLEQYIRMIGEARVLDESIDFGLISPYRVQVQYLRQLVKKNGFLRPFRQAITVHTVDGFQGQERDVVFISLVRANEQGEIGFLNDLRRMNVAITRARMKLIILGDAPTLTRHSFYRALYEYIGEHGKIVEILPVETVEEVK